MLVVFAENSLSQQEMIDIDNGKKKIKQEIVAHRTAFGQETSAISTGARGRTVFDSSDDAAAISKEQQYNLKVKFNTSNAPSGLKLFF